ncbi:hypothetical protein A2962_02100 [Candidatus Woesebacteria bacterium RIFCSPLOWO2_01_FULL_39_61]|uniref:HNH nuclease domain-containing protein n=1 Tax=Candidatus Woesebacteria bacterium RIFCSPHIGHO2_02_FULL_39_13 TaxID=1802505 RepID=A0A1F7YYP0_9BACT|nr:MAG: hypothetical protein A2692_03100 [Candidatus Woesebacteria bacterium RIFCSPHIGHO2_01_FULL_39_95]OGM32340.1 MAG: hypothetical protein A3D01_04735 [Candidatus Woesebacteria bacterium RIFCSPHIGHO2_02_FULL_39_13]OGM37026.1 MAG: hypothetical protein A3E13_03695 [Candidatus Woesebacteria bacterium RIFCSPHIGHO2_12_FULL_40_20]OGM67936.1 MAG: hypothetical protein A2962_02100 [Candidatus Woesebacteria bacterium RIFCSPLOWO2_01_FULL_39_61]OGM72229.1 MAG: hypothetical protein A3H19_02245 [Candidatus
METQDFVITHAELSNKEGMSLQRGMNYRPGDKEYSIFLMSVSPDAPYNDGFDAENKKLFYEGEDVSKREKAQPKEHDQPFFTKTGKRTNNGKFFKIAEDYKLGRRNKPEQIKVYEKIKNNVWSDKGFFYLTDAKYEHNDRENRKTFKFVLEPVSSHTGLSQEEYEDFEFSRRIPTEIKRIVWERDEGKCAKCGSKENLHFDHLIPFSKGGSSLDPKNIQVLCGKHNLQKSDKIL